MTPLLKKLLANRGIEREEDAQKFLHPNYDTDLHDPFLLTDMEKAVERVCVAMRNGEKIILYTDYDTDGIPAGVLLHDFFKSIGYANFENHIPHRNNDGYGLNKNAIQSFIEKGARLIVRPGTTFYLEPGVSIFSYGPVEAKGTLRAPISLEAASPTNSLPNPP